MKTAQDLQIEGLVDALALFEETTCTGNVVGRRHRKNPAPEPVAATLKRKRRLPSVGDPVERGVKKAHGGVTAAANDIFQSQIFLPETNSNDDQDVEGELLICS